MEKIFLSILNMSLTSSFVIAAIMLVRLPLKKAPKIISYALWAVAGFRLICPFTVESAFSLIPFKAAPIPQDIAMQAIPRIDSGINTIDNIVSGSLPAAVPYASINPMQVLLFIGSHIWLFGVAVMLIYSVVSIVLLERKLHSAAPIKGNLFEDDNLKTPFVIGLFRPKIYIPAGLSDEERRYIILHEQTHILRHDHAVKMFAYLVLCLHWFNPFVWAAFVLMGADMEMACDERVLKELGGDIKNAYSLSLVRVAAGRKILNGSPLAFGEGDMKERIKNVLNFKKPSRVIIIAAVALAALLSVGFAVNRIADGSILDSIIPMSMNNVAKEPHFAGTVTQVYENAILVSVNEDEDVRRSSDLISVSLNVKLKDSMTHFTVGDKVIVYYNGEIAESYPAQVNTVYAIVLTSADMNINIDDLNALFAMRTPYVGDNSAVGKIVNALPRLDREHTQRFFSIGDDYGTGRAPFTLTVYYEPNDAETSDVRNITVTPKNSALLFALIDNLEEVNYAFRSTPSDAELDKAAYTSHVAYSKEDITEYLATIGLDWEDFQNDWSGSIEKMFAELPLSAYEPREWLNYFLDEQMPWNGNLELELPEYPDTAFRWTPYAVTAIDSNGEKKLFDGMPIWNVYLADLTGDSLPEFCATVSMGSGIVDERVVVYDYAIDRLYELSDRMYYDYVLSMEDGRLAVTQAEYIGRHSDGAKLTVGSLAIVNGELTAIGIDRARPEIEPKETTEPDEDMSDISQRVEDGLRSIMSSPLTSSNPQDYINAHQEEYENLTMKYSDGVLEYLLSQFEAGNTEGLRGHIMMRMCKEMLRVQNNVTDESLSPQEWYEQLSIISEIELPDFKPENPNGEYEGLVYSAITQHYSSSGSGFMVAAPTIYGAYEEEGKLKIFVTVFYERYRLYGKALESTGGAVIPGAIVFSKDNTGSWEFEEYLEVGSANLPDGMYYNDSIRKLCVMPVSGEKIEGLDEQMSEDYRNDARQELLAQNLKEHLTAYGQTGVSLQIPDGSRVELT